MRTVLLKEMSTSKELVELTELYKNIQLQEFGDFKNLFNRNKKTDKDKQDIKKENELNDVLNKLKSDKKDDKDDDKEEIKGPNINNNKKSDSSTTNNNLSKTDKEDLKKSVKTYHATDRSGRDFDDPEADSDVRGCQEKKPIVASAELVPLPAHNNSTPDLPLVVLTDHQIFAIVLLASSVMKVKALASIFVTSVSPDPSHIFVNFITVFVPDVATIV